MPRKRSPAGAAAAPASAVEQARRQARQRLIGAAVLLTLGVIAFPVVFETQPRPAVPADLPMRFTQGPEAAPGVQTQALARGDEDSQASPTAQSGGAGGSAPVGEPVPEPVAGDAVSAGVGNSGPDAVLPVQPPAAAGQPPSDRPDERPPEPSNKRLPPSGPATAPQSPLATADTKPTTAQAAGSRFIVQVGAFSDAGTVRNLRARIERLGLTTYTQTVDTAGGRRIRLRLGPYDSREEANRALEKLQKSGLSGGMVLSL